MKATVALLYSLVAALSMGSGCLRSHPTQAPGPVQPRGSFCGLYQWYGNNQVPMTAAPANTYRRFVWKELERGEGEYDFSPIERALKEARSKRQKFGFRVMACLSESGMVVPSYLAKQMPHGFWFDYSSTGREDTYAPDWNSPAFLAAATRLLNALGKQFDGDPALAWVDIGLYGNWGEWHTARFPYAQHPDAAPGTSETKHTLIDAHLAAFPRTRLLMMTDDADGLTYALRRSPRIGMRRDSLGHKWFAEGLRRSPEAWALSSERWKTAPFVTEFYAPSPSGMLDLAAEQVSEYHVTLVGNGNTTTKFAAMSPEEQTQFAALNDLAGAHFEIAHPAVKWDLVRQRVHINFALLNKGNAPAYDPWRVRCLVRDSRGTTVAKAGVQVDLEKVLPDDVVHTDLSIPLPSNLAQGNYEIVLVAEDPSGYLPNQPIGRVTDASTRGTLLGRFQL